MSLVLGRPLRAVGRGGACRRFVPFVCGSVRSVRGCASDVSQATHTCSRLALAIRRRKSGCLEDWMDLHLQGKRAIVGASTAGLGFGAAKALAGEGADVAICGRDRRKVDDAVKALRGRSGRVFGFPADLSTPQGAADFVSEAMQSLGGVDILVPNAGGPPPGTFASTTIDDYQAALNLNLLSTVAMCQVAVPGMVDQGWGRVVAITSLGVRQPIATLIASVTARAGVTGFLKVLAGEVAAHGVTVNSLQPGLHDTDRLASLSHGALSEMKANIPTASFGDAADFGAILAFLCGDHAKFVTGVALPVDGGAYGGLM